jgi:anaerobic magnesium-protoporphyrin IX monomethyl ester cyclase
MCKKINERVHLLLVNPLAPKGAVYINPLGIQTLGSYIKSRDKSTKVTLFDFNAKGATSELFIEMINEYDIVGFSTPFGSLPHLKEILLNDVKIQKILENKPLLLGGSTATAASRELFDLFGKKYSGFYIMKGEGEIPLLQFIRYLRGEIRQTEVPGLIWKNEDALIENPRVVDGLSDFYEPPIFTDEIIAAANDGGGILFLEGLSRGCEYDCTFCYLRMLRVPGVPRVRYFPPSRIIETIKRLEAKGSCDLNVRFTDENFFGGKTREEMYYRMNQALIFAKNLKQAGSRAHFGIDIRADSLFNSNDTDDLKDLRGEVWQMLVRSGLMYVYIGVETFSVTQLRRYGKSLDLSTIKKAIELLRQLGIRFTVGLITFDPLMDFDELKENIKFIEENNLIGNISSISKEMRIQRGTLYYEMVNKMGIALTFNQDDLVFYDYNPEDYIDSRMGKIASAMRWFYKLFNENNYRFPDVPAFLETLVDFPSQGRDVREKLLMIPKRVAQLELSILKYMISRMASDDPHIDKDAIRIICDEQINEITSLLDFAVTIPCMPWKYYFTLVKLHGVFHSIALSLKQEALRDLSLIDID